MYTHDYFSQPSRRQKGFSFVEMLIVLAVLSVVAVQQLHSTESNSVDQVADHMVEKIQRVQRASMRFYRANNAWPDNVNTLVTNKFLTSGEENDSWGEPFVLAINNQDLSVSTDVKEVRYASRVTGRLPRAQISGETKSIVTSWIDRPGEEAAHEALYSLDGSRKLTGAMDADGNDITKVATITGRRFIDLDATGFLLDPASKSTLNELTVKQITLAENVKVGDDCDVKTIGTTRLGKFVSCEKMSDDASSTWRASHELPVGSIYIAVTEESPAVSLGYGTWKPFGEGQVLVGSISADAPDKCAPGGDVLPTSVSADCLFYELQATHDGSTGAAALSLRQMPDHRHFNWITLSEENKCEPECLILSDNPSTNSTSAAVAAAEAFDARAASSNREGNVRINSRRSLSPLEEIQAALALLQVEYEIVLALLKRPMQRVGEKTNSQETHQHGVHPAITVAMWKRIS